DQYGRRISVPGGSHRPAAGRGHGGAPGGRESGASGETRKRHGERRALVTAVLLINMPFAALDSPSLALGMFKARFLADGIPCDVQDLNWRFAEAVGPENYDFVLRLSAIMAGEQLFARALFGDWLPPDSEYYREILSNGAASADVPSRLE